MYSPRFAQPNNMNYQMQWRPHYPRFGPRWPMQPKNQPQNFNLIGQGNFSNNENHWCETCDRGFRTSELLINHKQQHQKCNIDGCQFIAHPKVITKHIQMQHSTGLYKKIAKLNNPEEIQKWKEERRKRYPTKENIEKKNAEIKEKIERGEKMGMKSHRENKPYRTEQSLKRKYSYDVNKKNNKRKFQANKSINVEVNKNKILNNDVKKPPIPQREKVPILEVEDSKKLKAFTGILNLLDDTDNKNLQGNIEISDSIEDDEYIIMDDSSNKSSLTITDPVLCGALSSLMCSYESSDDESVHKTTQLPQEKSKDLMAQSDIEQNKSVPPNKGLLNSVDKRNDLEKSEDDSEPEEVKIVKTPNYEIDTNIPVPISLSNELSNVESSKRAERREKQDKNKFNKSSNTKKFRSKLPSTLLEKLLHTEIRQERNIILQCIRHIIRNNYFEKQEKKSS